MLLYKNHCPDSDDKQFLEQQRDKQKLINQQTHVIVAAIKWTYSVFWFSYIIHVVVYVYS